LPGAVDGFGVVDGGLAGQSAQQQAEEKQVGQFLADHAAS